MQIVTLQDLQALVRGHRKDLHLTQAELAARAGVSRRWVCMCEAGHETAEIGRVLAVLQAIDIHLTATRVPEQTSGAAGGTAGRTVGEQEAGPTGRDVLRAHHHDD